MVDLKLVFAVVGSLCGYLILAHSAEKFLRSRWISPLELTKIGTAAIAMAILTSQIISSESPFAFWIVMNAAPALAFLSIVVLLACRRRRLEGRIDEFLISLLVLMRQGNSLRSALDIVAHRAAPSHRNKFRELARAVVFSQQKSEIIPNYAFGKKFSRVAAELTWIDRESDRPLLAVEEFRAHLRAELKIRRRSGQATAQARAQSVVMSALYIALATFSFKFFGAGSSWPWLGISAPLFLSGVIWMWLGGRRIRWTK